MQFLVKKINCSLPLQRTLAIRDHSVLEKKEALSKTTVTPLETRK